MEAIKVLAKILTNILTALYEPFGYCGSAYYNCRIFSITQGACVTMKLYGR